MNPDDFEGHGLLDDEATYQLHGYKYGWAESVWGYARVDGHRDEILDFRLAVLDDHEISWKRSFRLGQRDLLGLSVSMVNETLERMNWINATE